MTAVRPRATTIACLSFLKHCILDDDEWADDDDNGYVTVTISTEEFFELEEVCLKRPLSVAFV